MKSMVYYLPEREPFTLPSAAVYTFGSERFAFRAGSSVTIASRAPALLGVLECHLGGLVTDDAFDGLPIKPELDRSRCKR
jgi:hypothetical protein